MSKEYIIGCITVILVGIGLIFVYPPLGIIVICFGLRGFILNKLEKSGENKIISFLLGHVFLFAFALIGLALLYVYPPVGIIYFIIFFFINRKR